MVYSVGIGGLYGEYICKFIVAILMTPVIYIVHGAIEKYLGEELATKLKIEAVQDKNATTK